MISMYEYIDHIPVDVVLGETWHCDGVSTKEINLVGHWQFGKVLQNNFIFI